MKDFALDLWFDLWHKRLLPVAIALGIALLAVPLVLLKGEPEAVQPPFGKQESSNETMPVVKEDASSLGGSSKLGIFDRKNPFRSLARLPESAQPSAGGTATGPDAGVAGGAGDDPVPGGGDAGLASGDDPMAPGGGSAAGSSAGSDPASGASSGGGGGGSSEPPQGSGSGRSDSGGSGSGGSGSPTPSPAPSPADPQFFEYVAEVDFGRVGNEKRYRDVRALDSLPSERNPVVVYLGQTRSNESAFLVNQAIGQRGEGNCVPNRSSCNIVYLRPTRDQDDHYFLTGPPNDFTYHLKLIAVRRKLDGRDASARSRAKSSDARTRVEGAKSKRKVRRTAFDFRIPLIAGQRR